ncbi:MAG: hypothetical protein U0T73_07980 [Chitinophagales bacterium]
MRQVFLFLLISVLASCSYFKNRKPSAGEQVIARVGDEYLYRSDLDEMLKGADAKDSAVLVANYAEAWARKKLLLKKAEENVSANELGIDKKVEDYRESLLLYEYEKELINQKLDKQVNDKELQDFYEQNKNSFLLENTIYSVKYARIRRDAEDLAKMQQVILKPKNEDEERRREGYCKAFASSYSFRDINWMAEPALTAQFPFPAESWMGFANDKSWHQIETEKEFVYVQVTDVKAKGEIAPYDFITDQLREVFFNKKKVVMIEKIYDRIFEDAVKKGNCEVLVKSK